MGIEQNAECEVRIQDFVKEGPSFWGWKLPM